MRTRALLALLAAALLAPAAPANAAPKPGALFGGGALGAGTRGSEDADAHFLGARIGTTDPAKLTFFADIALKCAGGRAPTLSTIQVSDVQIAPDGTFAGQTEFMSTGALGSEGGPVTYAGRFASDTRITGTVSATSTVRLNGKAPYSCRSGTVRYAMVDNANDPNAAPRRAGGRYVGTTNQDFSVLLRLSRDRDHFLKAAMQGNLACKNAKDGVFNFEIIPGRLIKFGKGNRFRGVEHFTSQKAYVKPAFTRVTWVLTGRFADGKLSGAWQGTLKVYDPKRKSRLIDTCTTRIPFRAALV